jgi:MFS superfamily sulfate permease-like transporter
LKKLILLTAMLAMTMVTTSPALAQTGQEIAKTGIDGATLLTLGVGVLLVAGGLLVRHIFGKF